MSEPDSANYSSQLRKVKKVSSQLLHENGHEPTPQEIADRLGITVDRVREILRISQDPVSLETPIGEEEDSHLGDFIPDDEAPAPAEAASYALLKEQLIDEGHMFKSDTDTEVVAQLLDYYYSDCGDFFEAMNRLLHAVDGAYALGIICADYPDRLVAARKYAPLLLGFGDGENFSASDVTALIRHTRDIAYMDDGELAILSRSGIRVYDRQLRPVEKKHHHVDWEVDAAEKGGYAHFILKEIMEQPAAIRKATAARIQGGRVVLQDLTMTPEQIRAIGRIYIVACGSSYHVGMVGKYNLERMLRRSVEVCLASEFRYCDPIVGEGDLVIVISQSGEIGRAHV